MGHPANVSSACAALSTNRSMSPTDELYYATYAVILPIEMVIGFVLQGINFVLLKRSRIRSLRYTVYLRALCLTYLINVITLIPVTLIRNQLIDTTVYWQVFYAAHLLIFSVNVFLQTGNLIIVTLAIEPLRALLFPFQNLQRSEGGRRNIVVVCCLFLVVFLICIPMLFNMYVEDCGNGHYASVKSENHIVHSIQKANAVFFELLLIVVISVVYSMLFVRYLLVRRKHAEHSGQASNTNRATHHQKHQRATAMCLGSITAFLVCNLPSALYECIALHYHNRPQPKYMKSMKQIANIFLLFTYTLNFIMQGLFSDQYRRELYKLVLCRQGIDEKDKPVSLAVSGMSTYEPARRRTDSRNDINSGTGKKSIATKLEPDFSNDLKSVKSESTRLKEETVPLVTYADDSDVNSALFGVMDSDMKPIVV